MNPIKKSLTLTALLILGFPVFVAMLVFGSCGMAYLLDYDGTGPLRQHPQFHAIMETLNKLNMAFTPLIFNVGLVGAIGCFIYFSSPQEEAVQVADSKKKR